MDSDEELLLYNSCGTQMYLEHLAGSKPEIFHDKQRFMELIEELPCGYERACDSFYNLLDDSLKKDEDVVRILLERYCKEPGKYNLREYKRDFPAICRDMPQEFLMDETIKPMLIKTIYTWELYGGLSNELRLNDDMFASIIAEAVKECKHDGNANNLEKSLQDIQELWSCAIDEIENVSNIRCDFATLEEQIDLWKSGDILDFFKSFFGFLSNPGFLNTYKGKQANTIREKCDLYLEYLMDSNADQINEIDIFADDGFVLLLEKYWYQICIFAAAYIKDYDMVAALYQDR